MINNNQYNNDDVLFTMLEFTIKYDEFEKEKLCQMMKSDRIRFSIIPKKIRALKGDRDICRFHSFSLCLSSIPSHAEWIHETAKIN